MRHFTIGAVGSLAASLAILVPVAVGQIELSHPTQFYTNGEQVDAWTRNDQQGLSSTFWLVKHPANSLSYRQQIVISYDTDPDRLYYYDVVSELFVGRYDMESEKYSLLNPQDRSRRLEDIPQSAFPPPGDKPRVREMFPPLPQGPPNPERLMMPPATMSSPRLQNSQWKGFYTDIGANRRRQMTLKLEGRTGTFEAPKVDIQGRFSHVQYGRRDGMPVIHGTWSAGNTGGGFEFRLMGLSEFQGEYWVGDRRDRTFLWDGKRVSR